jgi:hypothetical protein
MWRVVVAFALASCVDADVPAFCPGPACTGSQAGVPARSAAGSLGPRMVAQDYLAHLEKKMPAGYVPRTSPPAPAHAQPVVQAYGPTEETSSVQKWTAPVGYEPRRAAAPSADYAMAQAWSEHENCESRAPMSALPIEHAESIMARVSEMMLAQGEAKETLAPAAKLKPYGGYDPKSRMLPTPAPRADESVLVSRPAETHAAPLATQEPTPRAQSKWKPYAGYDPLERRAISAKLKSYGGGAPKSRMLSTPTPRAYEPVDASGSRPAETHAAPAATPCAPTPGAPSKWKPYVGYDPMERRAIAPAPAASTSTPTVKATSTAASAPESARAPPAKRWQPYGGYVPQKRKTEVAAQPTHSSEASQVVPTHHFGPVAASDSEDDSASLSPSASTFDAASSERAQQEIDALGRIKDDFIPRLDAAGARAAGNRTHTDTNTHTHIHRHARTHTHELR